MGNAFVQQPLPGKIGHLVRFPDSTRNLLAADRTGAWAVQRIVPSPAQQGDVQGFKLNQVVQAPPDFTESEEFLYILQDRAAAFILGIFIA